MQLSEFDYDLPKDRIALHPVEERDQARLMRVVRASGEIFHHVFSDLDGLLQPNDLLVLNNTRVFPARLFGQRRGLTSESYQKEDPPKAKIEMLLLRPLGNDVWEVLVKPGRKMRVGERLYFAGGRLEVEILERSQLGVRKVRFYYSGNFDEIIDQLGHVPLPPYIRRPEEPQDKQRYQTIYAKKRGAVAAPTAGLHFTPPVFDRLGKKGIKWCEITLHVGLSTFQPVHSEQIEDKPCPCGPRPQRRLDGLHPRRVQARLRIDRTRAAPRRSTVRRGRGNVGRAPPDSLLPSGQLPRR